MYGVHLPKVPRIISAFVAAGEELLGGIVKGAQAFCKVIGKHPAIQELADIGIAVAKFIPIFSNAPDAPAALKRAGFVPVLAK